MTTHAKATYIADSDFTLYLGDVREVLAQLPAESVHCVVTSPPYWGLRDYGTGVWDGGDPDCDHVAPPRSSAGDGLAALGEKYRGGGHSTVEARPQQYHNICGKCGARRVDQQLGLEPTPGLYVQNMVSVFREVRRVLRRDGTCWLNIGDSYAAGKSGRADGERRDVDGFTGGRKFEDEGVGFTQRSAPPGFKPKDLVGIPWRLAFALQADGWYLRADVIWSKPNPMPESVTDRPTKAHEYLFLLTRSPRYFYDADAIREPHQGIERPNWDRVPPPAGTGSAIRNATGMTNHNHRAGNPYAGRNRRSVWEIAEEQPTLDPSLPPEKPRGPDGRRKTTVTGGEGSIQHRDGERWPAGGANRRSVWNIATEPYPDAHFATFPQALVEPCVLAGTSERGCCPECGAPWERETERTPAVVKAPGSEYGHGAGRNDGGRSMLVGANSETTGWREPCNCRGAWGTTYPVPCTVLDPFMGSGTTALVARRFGRKSIGIELNEEYARLCAHRLRQLSLFA